MSENEKKPISAAQRKAVAKYMKNHYDEIKLRLPVGYKAKIQKAAEANGDSINGYVKKAIDSQLNQQ